MILIFYKKKCSENFQPSKFNVGICYDENNMRN